jgi:hypothetical protein
MKIYICTDGDYSDYHIEAVFSTREKAEEWLLSRTVKLIDPYAEDWGGPVIPTSVRGQIEEYDLDAPIPETVVFDDVQMNYDGTVSSVSSHFYNPSSWMPNDHINGTYGYAIFHVKRVNRDLPEKERAIKIANERRTRLIAEGIWKPKMGFMEIK